jgi:uncharacterized protein YdhG (YjbR/CyaY superfamily)
MRKIAFQSVDESIAVQPEDIRPVLERLRSIIRKAVPAAGETIAYNMPTYRLGEAPVLSFAAWAKHYSLYTSTGAIVDRFPAELAGYKVDKGTIQFPVSEPLPAKLIERIARFRAQDVAVRERLNVPPPETRRRAKNKTSSTL